MEVESEIAKWYRGKAIFVTGATGFMGKILIEKLLRSCPDVGLIYVLVRDKKKMSSRDRIGKLLSTRAFEKIRTTRPDLSNEQCLVPIPGDLGQPGLGISVQDELLLQKTVSVVFHVAATVSFDDTLRIATKMNIEGTEAVLELCRGMTSLRAVVHVSTAYANCVRSVIEERIYPPPADPNDIKNLVLSLNDDNLDLLTPRLRGEHPNTYTFTKAVAEHVVAGYSTQLPIVVVRPSIVCPSWKEPEPGWVDSLNGPCGILLAAAKGLVKTYYGKGELVADMIPVDVSINLLIAAAWEIGTREGTKFSPDVRVYNCVSGPFKPVTWGNFVVSVDKGIKKYVTSDIFMIPGGTMTNCRLKHMLTKSLLQTLPAAVADFFIWLSGGKPKFRYYQRQITKVSKMLEYFCVHEWEFEVINVERLRHQLSPIDRKIFNFDMTKINWEEYFDNSCLGLRRYVINEKDETIQAARKNLARWVLVRKIIKLAVFATGLYFVLKFYGASLTDVI